MYGILRGKAMEFDVPKLEGNRNYAELNLCITIEKDPDGGLRIDCHSGIETVFPIGCSTCISIEENIETFFHTLEDLIEEVVEDINN